MDSTRPAGRRDARARLGRLTEVLEGIAATAEARCRTRCPYRDVRGRCTYAAACANQASIQGGVPVCGGDNRLRFEAPMDAFADARP